MTRVLVIAQNVWRETLRRKDVYVLLILALAFLVILMSLNIFGLRRLVGYVKETGLLLAWIFGWILTIGVSVRQLPQEEKTGTIFSLLAKPVKRHELLLGKWLGAWIISGAATAFFYLLLAIVVRVRSGYLGVTLTLEALLLHMCFLGVLAAMAILFSSRMNSDAASSLTAVISVAAYLVLPQIPWVVAETGGWEMNGLLFLYYALPHLELFDLRLRMVNGLAPVGAGPFFMIVGYAFLMTAILLILTWILYRRKRFNRDEFA